MEWFNNLSPSIVNFFKIKGNKNNYLNNQTSPEKLLEGLREQCEKGIHYNFLRKKKSVFLMEAMWSRFFPVNLQARKWLAEGLIGDPLYLMVDIGFKGTFNPINGCTIQPWVAVLCLMGAGRSPDCLILES